MSQDYHQGGIFSFLNGFDRSQQEQEQERLQGFHPPPPPPPRLVAIEEVEESNGPPGYETTGMLSEMFYFTSGATSSTAAHTLSLAERGQFPTTTTATTTTDWYGRHEAMVVGGGGGCLGQLDSSNDHNDNHHQTQQISGLNATDSAGAMQLFLMNPQPAARSPSPSPSSHHHHHPSASSSTPHMLLLPNPSPTSTLHHHHHSPTANINPFGPSQFPWVNQDRYNQSQGLSLTLSSSLQAGNKKQLADDDDDDLRLGEISGMLLFNNHHQPLMHMDHHNQQIHHMGYESSLGTVNGLRNSKYSKATQELLQEFCSIGSRGGQLLLKKNKPQLIIKQETNINPNPNNNNNDHNNNPSGTGVGGNSSSSSKDPPPPLSAADRLEHQRRKVKLLSMLDEVDKRYNHYCEQMQMVVNSFDLMMGFGAAVPYTALAQKAMSRHFRCFKDSIAMQLKQSCELLGEKDTSGTSGVTKGETPRLKLLEQSIRQQRVFHQMGMMMDQEAWRPQRGLPERSVNILRAWLFDHFLHPYPSDADKHLLARQTGLSKNQVSNWFINARVRLWKPMVEEMYQHESKEQDEDEDEDEDKEEEEGREREINPNNNNNDNINAQTMQNTAATATAERSEFNDCYKNNPSLNRQHPTTTNSSFTGGTPTAATLMSAPFPPAIIIRDETSGSKDELGSTLIRFGKSAGDVSLTLGLRHTGNLPENNNNFAVTDFAGF